MGLAINIGIFLVTLMTASGTAVTSTGACPRYLDLDAKRSGSCDTCAVPIRHYDAALVIVTTLADGGYAAVWQSTFDGSVYVQCYTRARCSRGAQFRLDADAKDGILPVLVPQEDRGFLARWQQVGQRFEQHFNGQCAPLEAATLRK